MRHLPFAYVAEVETPVLDDADHHHLARVRRVRDGDPMVVGDGAGHWRTARFGAAPEPTGNVQFTARSQPEVGVGFALVKGSKPELVVQKLTELGIDRIVPFVAARSVVRWDASKAGAAHQRLVKVAREAGMQSRQTWLPTVDPVATFAQVAAEPGAAITDPDGRAPTLAHPFLLVGPEGGWAPEEYAAALPQIGLADRGVLRAETAAIVAGALLVALRAGLVSET